MFSKQRNKQQQNCFTNRKKSERKKKSIVLWKIERSILENQRVELSGNTQFIFHYLQFPSLNFSHFFWRNALKQLCIAHGQSVPSQATSYCTLEVDRSCCIKILSQGSEIYFKGSDYTPEPVLISFPVHISIL